VGEKEVKKKHLGGKEKRGERVWQGGGTKSLERSGGGKKWLRVRRLKERKGVTKAT